jgi:hypothetical protein
MQSIQHTVLVTNILRLYPVQQASISKYDTTFQTSDHLD